MARLPVVSGRQAVQAFEKAGWHFVRQRDSHLIMSKPEAWANLSIPDDKELSPGTLRALVRAAGMSVEEFTALL